MSSARLGFLALSACSVLFLGCPAPVDMHDPDASSGSGGSSAGTGGSSSGSGGSTSGTGGSSSGSGGSTSGTGGSSSGTGGSSSGSGGSTPGTGGSSSGTGGSSGGTGGMAGGDAGGGGGMEAGAANGTKVPADVQAVFMKCGTACHGGNWGDATKSLARLKGMASCGNLARMKVGDGAGSLTVQKMKGPVANCGAQMPLPAGAMKLSAAEIKTVEDWITAGAKPVP